MGSLESLDSVDCKNSKHSMEWNFLFRSWVSVPDHTHTFIATRVMTWHAGIWHTIAWQVMSYMSRYDISWHCMTCHAVIWRHGKTWTSHTTLCNFKMLYTRAWLHFKMLIPSTNLKAKPKEMYNSQASWELNQNKLPAIKALSFKAIKNHNTHGWKAFLPPITEYHKKKLKFEEPHAVGHLKPRIEMSNPGSRNTFTNILQISVRFM